MVDARLHGLLCLCEFRQFGRETGNGNLVGQIVLDGVRQDEVTVGQTLHQGGSTQTVGTMVGEVTFTDGKQALDGSLKLVVYPDTAHRVVDSRINHHRIIVFHAVDFVSQLTGVHVGDFFVHVEKIAVTLEHYVDAQTLDTFREVEEYGQTGIVHTETFIATLLGCT